MNVLENLAVAVFWLCLGLVFYAYAGYPVVIWCLARCFGRQSEGPAVDESELPTVSLLIAAYNEAAVIGERVQNALEIDYPADRLEIVVASDGSDDATAAIVSGFADRGVRLLDYRERRGKAAVLNAAFPELNGEIAVLSDANTCTDRDALRRLAPWFHDPRVGAVCGRLILTDPVTGRNADSMYWTYENFLKRCEGRLGALLGANGAIYAIRRDLFRPLPAGTLVDDFVLPLLARLHTRCAIVYEGKAIAREETAADVKAEFHRRSRIGAGGFQSIGVLWRLLNPLEGWVAFTFASHKVLRWLGPFFLFGMVVTNLLLLGQPFFRWMLGAQLAFYIASWAASYLPPGIRLLKPLRLTTMFTGMNIALFVGFCRWLRGGQKGTWKRTARLAEAEATAQ